MRMFSAPLPCLHPACAELLCTASFDTIKGERNSTHPCRAESLSSEQHQGTAKAFASLSWKKGRPCFSSVVSPALMLGNVRNFTEGLVFSWETKWLRPSECCCFFSCSLFFHLKSSGDLKVVQHKLGKKHPQIYGFFLFNPTTFKAVSEPTNACYSIGNLAWSILEQLWFFPLMAS